MYMRHRITDRQTDNRMMPIAVSRSYCVAVRSAKNIVNVGINTVVSIAYIDAAHTTHD